MMDIHIKIGVSLLLLIAVVVLIISVTAKGIFSLYGTISIIGLSLFGAYAFGKRDDE